MAGYVNKEAMQLDQSPHQHDGESVIMNILTSYNSTLVHLVVGK
jgi:hypothetical protein